jgi:hypothetical protein
VNPNDETSLPAPLFPITVSLSGMPLQRGSEALSVTLNSGLTTLIGPNGSGKTQVLRAMRPHLQAKLSQLGIPGAVRYLAAGRAAPFEQFRSASLSPGDINAQPAAVGNRSFAARRMELESLIGDIMALEERSDLRIKVEARLFALFHRRIKLRWIQSGIEVSFQSSSAEYAANTEASGILHLVGLLAALHDDRIGALLIDEPEVSLHPQLQAFLLAEILRVAGNPLDGSLKKVIVMATHSQSMLPLREMADLPGLVFFSSPHHMPRQLSPTEGVLKSQKLGALVKRLGEGHRSGFFAETAFLVEGPSDEIIVSMLSARLGRELAGSGTQIVPVIGKGEIPETVRLFRLMGKRVVVLADLDALADANSVLMTFGDQDEVKRAAEERGFASLAGIDSALRNDLAQIVTECWSEIASLVEASIYLAGIGTGAPSEQTMRRAALSVILVQSDETLSALPNGSRWCALKARFNALLAVLEAGGCFFLQRGTIEAYYGPPAPAPDVDKPRAAVDEAATFASSDEQGLRLKYEDVWRAIERAAPPPAVDEDSLLRGLLASLLAAVFQEMTVDTSDADLAATATVNESAASIFRLENISNRTTSVRALRISIKSPLFRRDKFPATVGYDDHLHSTVAALLN